MFRPIVPAAALLALLAGCSRVGEIGPTGGITVVRTACPTVAVPAGTGDITLFNPPQARTANAIDVTAAITNVRSTCSEGGSEIVTTITFDIIASRRDAGPAREVTFPYFIAIVRGGTNVTAKRIAQATVRFDAGQTRAQTSATATSVVNRAAATLPENIRRQITREREAGDRDAAIDPLAVPEVRQAVLRASFEALVGFQLTEEQLRYNVTR